MVAGGIVARGFYPATYMAAQAVDPLAIMLMRFFRS